MATLAELPHAKLPQRVAERYVSTTAISIVFGVDEPTQTAKATLKHPNASGRKVRPLFLSDENKNVAPAGHREHCS